MKFLSIDNLDFTCTEKEDLFVSFLSMDKTWKLFFQQASESVHIIFSSFHELLLFLNSPISQETLLRKKIKTFILNINLEEFDHTYLSVFENFLSQQDSLLWASISIKLQLPPYAPKEKSSKQYLSCWELLDYFFKAKISFILIDPYYCKDYSWANFLQKCFQRLQDENTLFRPIYFFDRRLLRDDWNAKTKNIFSGPKYLDLDISNFCTHNCTFCGLYSPQIQQRAKNNREFHDYYQNFTRQKLDTKSVINFLENLPLNITEMQLGGAGDPFTHPHVMEFIQIIRQKNIRLSILTNGAYFKKSDLGKLKNLSGNKGQLHFFINLSAASFPTYQKIRPNQSLSTWNKLMSDLPDLKSFTIMCVVTKDNFEELPNLVYLAKKLGARDLWLKPLENHGDHTLSLQIPEEKQNLFQQKIQETLDLAVKEKVSLFDSYLWENQVKGKKTTEHFQDYYMQNACFIGLDYLRVTTKSEMQPCCVMNKTLAKLDNNFDFWNSWVSKSYQDFRLKTESIAQEHFHLRDSDWSFCKNCPHIFYNKVFKELSEIPTPPPPNHFFRSLDL